MINKMFEYDNIISVTRQGKKYREKYHHFNSLAADGTEIKAEMRVNDLRKNKTVRANYPDGISRQCVKDARQSKRRMTVI